MKKSTNILLLFIAFVLASCNPEKSIKTYDFEGEYELRTQVVSELMDGTFDTMPYALISPMKIYVEANKLYVQTDYLGLPDLASANPVAMDLRRDPPKPIDTTTVVIPDSLNNDSTSQGIENVVVENKAHIVMSDGIVITLRDDIWARSLPIRALSVEENKIVLGESDTFEVPLTDAKGDLLQNVTNQFIYSPIKRENNELSWDVSLKMSFSKPEINIEVKGIKYLITIKRL
jgi:hypothetical protein